MSTRTNFTPTMAPVPYSQTLEHARLLEGTSEGDNLKGNEV